MLTFLRNRLCPGKTIKTLSSNWYYFRMAMSSSTTISSTVTTVLGVLNTTVTSGLIHSETVPTTAVGDISPTSAEAAPIFLETKAAQGIAGAFVWVALFVTCQQVCYN